MLEELITMIEEMVAIPSHEGVEQQETRLARYIHALFQSEGIESYTVEVEDGRENVIAYMPGETDKNLLFTGHLDTVPPYDMASPYSLGRDQDYLYGRGVVDMKGPLACMIFAMIQLARRGIRPCANLYFAGVIDEEEKSLGTIHLLESGLSFDAAIVGEPTRLIPAIAHRGLEWIQADFYGKAVHGGAQEDGCNAIEMAADFVNSLREALGPIVQKERHPLIGTSSYNLGKISGGTQPSTVAGEARILLDRRWVPGISHSLVMQQIDDILRRVTSEYPSGSAKLSIMEESVMKEGYVHPPLDTSEDSAIVRALKASCQSVLGEAPQVTFFPAWSDGGLLSSYGKIPAVIFAPGNISSAHSKEERIEISQLLPAMEIYLHLAQSFGTS